MAKVLDRPETKPDSRDFEERYNACFNDFALKGGAGFILGGMIGTFFLRGAAQKWPVIICSGIGLGMAYSNCENSLNEYLLQLDPKLCKVKKYP